MQPPAQPAYEPSGPSPVDSFVPVIVRSLIAVNAAVFLLTLLASGGLNPSDKVLDRFGLLYGPEVWHGEWWRLGSSMFLHGNLAHIAVNMWALNNLGRELEWIYGRRNFLLLYFGAGWLASLASLVFVPASLGASGAIFGLAGAWMALALHNKRYFDSFGRQVLGVIVINLFISYSLRTYIDLSGHVGGLIGGFLLGLLLPNKLPEFRRGAWRLPASLALLAAFLMLTPVAIRISEARLSAIFQQN